MPLESWFSRRQSSPALAEATTDSAILDATGSVVLVIDITTGRVVEMNKPTEIVTGFGREELLDRPLWETILRVQDRGAMKVTYDASVEAGLPLSYECTIATRSGEPRRVVWSGEFIRNERGQRTHLVMTGIDVTAIESTSGLFGHLMRAATTTAFVGTDLHGVVTFFSTGAEQMLGYSAFEMLGRVFPQSSFETAQFGERANALQVPADLRMLTMRERRAGDWTMVRKNGTELTVSLSVDPVTDTSGRLVGHLGVGHDVTEQRTTEDRLFATLELEREAVDRLRQLDQAKTEFVATVSHELRTPMASISGYIELLQDGAAGDLTPAQKKFADAISRNSDRLTALANDLLTLSRLESGTFTHEQTEVDLREVLGAARSALRPLIAGSGVDVTFEAPPDPVVVRGDASNLERLVSNLVGNAVKFTEDDGWVHCTLRLVHGGACIEVSDNGIGIPESEQQDLFTRFFRSSTALEHAIQGSGLGLTIVESIAHSHGGDVSVVSSPVHGSTFTVNLPLRGPQPT